jgi:hypothetical protein
LCQKLAYNYRASGSYFNLYCVFLTGSTVYCAGLGDQCQSPSTFQNFMKQKPVVRIVTMFETSNLYKTFCLLQIIVYNPHILQNSILCNIFITWVSCKKCKCVFRDTYTTYFPRRFFANLHISLFLMLICCWHNPNVRKRSLQRGRRTKPENTSLVLH